MFYKSKYDGNDLDFGPGLNMMYDTYNIISDNEEKANVPDLTAFEFYELTHNKVDNDQNKFIKDLIMFASVRVDKKVEEFNEMILSSDRFLFRYADIEQDLLIGNSYISKNKYSKDILSCNFNYINRIKVTLVGDEDFNIVATTNDGIEHTEDFYMLPSSDSTIEVHTKPKKEYSLQSEEPYYEYNDDAEINVGKKIVEDMYSKEISEKAKYTTIVIKTNISDNVEEKIDKLAELREKVNKSLLKNDFVFIRITGGLLLPIEGNYSVLDFMCEYRKDSEVIIVSKNKKGSLNQILLMVDLIKKVDLNLKKLVYKNSSEEKENKEVIERIKEITKLEYEII